MFSALISTPSLCLTWHAYLPFRVFPLVWTSFWPPAVPALRCVDWRWGRGDGGRVATTLDSASRGCEFESQCSNTSCTVLWMVRSLVAWSIFSIVITEKSYPFIPSIISARLKYRGGGEGGINDHVTKWGSECYLLSLSFVISTHFYKVTREILTHLR